MQNKICWFVRVLKCRPNTHIHHSKWQPPSSAWCHWFNGPKKRALKALHYIQVKVNFIIKTKTAIKTYCNYAICLEFFTYSNSVGWINP